MMLLRLKMISLLIMIILFSGVKCDSFVTANIGQVMHLLLVEMKEALYLDSTCETDRHFHFQVLQILSQSLFRQISL